MKIPPQNLTKTKAENQDTLADTSLFSTKGQIEIPEVLENNFLEEHPQTKEHSVKTGGNKSEPLMVVENIAPECSETRQKPSKELSSRLINEKERVLDNDIEKGHLKQQEKQTLGTASQGQSTTKEPSNNLVNKVGQGIDFECFEVKKEELFHNFRCNLF